ncbi:hypothetical protein ACFFJT_00085 [Dyella flava]|uniref:Uncharacterized protein n=1 Tax=Dyella flava TaxID=1920170 RepID=A0ABS2JZ44_9GAMM|nr:hypothetical protein [Dyella flava]MBM7124282.1 hypothetical protein [Dyella flava]GLQ50439.1 hypothetical protein GCM10010872_18880 [Dyella flava]
MRWLLLFATLLSWVLSFTRHSPGALDFWLLLGLAGIVATALAFAQARIEANARPEPSIQLMRSQQQQKSSQD